MTQNKGKPTQQKLDERKEREGNRDPAGPRTSHRLDRSRSDEKGGKGGSAKREAAPAQAGGRRG
jgi:hypothetical protein